VRVERIAVKNFLSFKDFVWDSPDTALNLIVGPNDAGKSNLLRAVRVVRDALDQWGSRGQWEGSAHGPIPNRPFSVSLDVALTSPWERDVLTAFVAAGFCDERVQEGTGGPYKEPEARSRLSELLRQRIEEFDCSWLFRGRLSVEYRGTRV
jgi:AAA domain